MNKNLPTNDLAATCWEIACAGALGIARSQQHHRRAEVARFLSDADRARNEGLGCPADDQTCQEIQ